MKNYLLLMPDESGNPITILVEDDLKDIKALMEDYGIEIWKDRFDPEDPQYWKEGEAMLLSYEIKVPKPVKVVEEYVV